MRLFWFLFLLCGFPGFSAAVEIAPRISDREIVERLTRLEEGQKALNQRFDDLSAQTDRRFDDMNQRFEDFSAQTDRRFNDMTQRFDDMTQRFDEMSRHFEARFTSLENTMLMMFGGLMALIVGLIGYIIWDRRTMMRPLEQKQNEIEKEVLELREEIRQSVVQRPEDSRLTRLIQALGELAKTDPQVATVMRSFSLL